MTKQQQKNCLLTTVFNACSSNMKYVFNDSVSLIINTSRCPWTFPLCNSTGLPGDVLPPGTIIGLKGPPGLPVAPTLSLNCQIPPRLPGAPDSRKSLYPARAKRKLKRYPRTFGDVLDEIDAEEMNKINS